MTRGKLIILLSLFALLSLFSISTVYYIHQLPTEEVRTTTLGTYKHTGTYDYIAKLKSNTIYNQSTLKPDEGILYTDITEYLNITFSYTFQSSQEANITLEYTINAILESAEWNKNFNIVPHTIQNSISNITQFSNNYLLNISLFKDLKYVIEQETKSRSTDYNVTLRPEIHNIANNNLIAIDEHFTPALTVMFTHGTVKGNYISTTDLEQTRSETITDTERIPIPGIMNQRYTSYAFCAATLSALATTGWAYTRKMKTVIKPPKPIEEIIAPYEEVIAESAGEPIYKGQTATITIRNLEDLVKVADWLGKPVLSYEKTSSPESNESTRVFYVLDGTTRYECTITAPTVTGEKAESETISEED